MQFKEAVSKLVYILWGFKPFEKAFHPKEYLQEIREKLEQGGYHVSRLGLILDGSNGRDYGNNLGYVGIEKKCVIISPSQSDCRTQALGLRNFLKEHRIPFEDRTDYYESDPGD